MENLELYDLDKLTILTSDRQLPPPLPSPRKHRRPLPPDYAFERYKFLCDMERHQTDPVYAATPMFTTIPQSKDLKYHRKILGSHVPSKIIQPISPKSPKSAESDLDAEEEQGQEKEEEEEKEESSDEEDDESSDSDDERGGNESSSSSSDDDVNILDDTDDDRGIVETIFNRHKK
jgi:hypothetical protein